MNKNFLKKRVQSQINCFLNDDNIISSTYPPSNNIIANNLDDLFPFFKYLELDNIIQEQVDLIIENYGYFPSKNNIDVPLWTYDEWIGALFLSSKIEHHAIANKILSKIIKGSEKFLNPIYPLKGKIKFPYFMPRVYGIFEVVFENKELIDKRLYEEYLKLYKNTLEYISEYEYLPVMDKGGLEFFDYQYRVNLLNAFDKVNGIKRYYFLFLIKLLNYKFRKTMKESSNFLFSFLEYLKIDPTKKNYYKKLLCNIIDMDGIPIKTYSQNDKYDLCQSTAIIDNICDYCYFIEKDEKLLNNAIKIANYFIEIYKEKKYLTRSNDSNIVFIDEVLDFAISLRRLYSISNNINYKKYSEIIYKSCEIFYSEDKSLMFTFYDVKNKTKEKIDPKYNFLFLKGIIIFEIEKNKDIYSDELYSLSKDR